MRKKGNTQGSKRIIYKSVFCSICTLLGLAFFLGTGEKIEAPSEVLKESYSFSLPNKYAGKINPYLPMMKRSGDLDEIKNYGYLRVIASSYEIAASESALLEEFSESHGLKTTWISVDDPEYAQRLLLTGQADILFGKATEKPQLIKTLAFQTDQRGATSWLLHKKNSQLKNALNHHLNRYFLSNNLKQAFQEDLTGLKRRKILRVAMRPDPYNYFLKKGRPVGFEYELLQKFAKQQRLRLDVIVSSSDTEIISWLKEGKADLIAANMNSREDPELISSSPYFPVRGAKFNLVEMMTDLQQKRHWTMNSQHGGLVNAINEFIDDEYRSRFYNITYQNYFTDNLVEREQQPAISPFDLLVKKYATLHEFDWRLIVAQMYQESQFSPGAISPAGARGLMQLMPATAREVGLKKLDDPEMSIQAGVIYMKKLRDRLTQDIGVKERSWFTLAAYNAGFERIKDARKFAGKLGLDPNKWFGHVELAMQKLAKPENLAQTRFGPCQCGQTVTYVREIRALFNSYIQLTDPLLIASVQKNLLVSNNFDSGLDRSHQAH